MALLLKPQSWRASEAMEVRDKYANSDWKFLPRML
jgi:hypothetical protein